MAGDPRCKGKRMMRFPMAAASVAMLAFLLVPTPALHAADQPASKPATSSDTYRQLDLFGQVFERVRADYVDEVSDQQLIESAINGMLSSLDPHSSYMNAKNFQDMQVADAGRVRRPRHRSHDGERPRQGRLADRRHAGRASAGLQAQRPHHRDRRRAGAGHDPERCRRQDARPGQQLDQADHQRAATPLRSTSR